VEKGIGERSRWVDGLAGQLSRSEQAAAVRRLDASEQAQGKEP
jgi:hypothetical protein